MPDLLASASLLPLTPAIPSRAPVAAPAAADFMALLGELVLPPGIGPNGSRGQALAGDGKDLPVTREDSGHGEDETDPAIAWLPAGLVPLPPIEPRPLPDTAPVALFVTTSKGVVAAPPEGAASSPEAVRALPQILAGADAAPITAAESGPPGPAPVEPAIAPTAEGEAAQVDLPPVAVEDDSGMNMEAPVREPRARPALAPFATPQPVVQGMAAAPTAGQVFAAAISAAFESPASPAPRAGDPVIAQAQAVTEQLRTTVQAMTGTEQPPLDLSRDDWAGKMVDRIASLRDAAEAADTRIRLAPENLGNVDVSIRRDGERLHVHFAAENAATRQLLAEAAPRLAELADARGVKLGQTSVDAGTGGQQGAPGQPQPNQSARPAPAAMRTPESDHDDRIA